MRQIGAALCSALLLLAPWAARPAGAEPAQSLYKVTVSRITENAYKVKFQDGVIVTSLCLELALSDRAILDYTPNTFSNRLYFSNGAKCAVEGVYRTNATLQRVGDDLYRDSRTGGYLRTQFCYVYVYGEDALVLQDRVIFTESDDGCDVSPV